MDRLKMNIKKLRELALRELSLSRHVVPKHRGDIAHQCSEGGTHINDKEFHKRPLRYEVSSLGGAQRRGQLSGGVLNE